MTTTELRELDAWIAVNVIGWVVKSRQSPHCGSTTNHFWYEAGNDIKPTLECSTQRMFPSGTIVGINCPEGIPHYTTDPAFSMEVLKKIAWGNRVTIYYSDGTWNVDDLRSCGSVETQVQADSLELAICLAAKKLFSK